MSALHRGFGSDVSVYAASQASDVDVTALAQARGGTAPPSVRATSAGNIDAIPAGRADSTSWVTFAVAAGDYLPVAVRKIRAGTTTTSPAAYMLVWF